MGVETKILYDYKCDGCQALAVGIPTQKGPQGWIMIPMAQPTENRECHCPEIEYAHFCGTCRWDPAEQRKMGAQLMGNGHWGPENEKEDKNG